MAHDRRQVEDAAVTLAFHLRQEGAAHEKDAGQVRVHDLPPLGQGKIGQRFADVNAGVVDKDLDFAHLGGDFLLELKDLRFVGYVSLKDGGFAAEAAHSGGSFI